MEPGLAPVTRCASYGTLSGTPSFAQPTGRKDVKAAWRALCAPPLPRQQDTPARAPLRRPQPDLFRPAPAPCRDRPAGVGRRPHPYNRRVPPACRSAGTHPVMASRSTDLAPAFTSAEAVGKTFSGLSRPKAHVGRSNATSPRDGKIARTSTRRIPSEAARILSGTCAVPCSASPCRSSGAKAPCPTTQAKAARGAAWTVFTFLAT